jgi:hypothetical protein
MELSIVKYIKEYGLSAAITDFKLTCKVYEKFILLKYDMIESPLQFPEVQDCRGLILEKDTWNVLSLGFRKFFNYGEPNAHKIDWSSAIVQEKLDGSMIVLWYYDNEWKVSTTGMAEAEGEVNNRINTSFKDLFWETFNKNGANKDFLDPRRIYTMELCTPYNIVVKPHGTSTITLLTIRDTINLLEYDYHTTCILGKQLGVPVVKAFDFKDMDARALAKTLEGMPYDNEGYVVVDKNFNRVKIKNPTYLAAHHLKSSTAFYKIMVIVKTNEVDEFIATFPERKDEIYDLKKGYDALKEALKIHLHVLKENYWPKDSSKEEKKKYAMAVLSLCNGTDYKGKKLTMFSGLFFGLADGKIKSIDEYLNSLDDKQLYTFLSSPVVSNRI